MLQQAAKRVLSHFWVVLMVHCRKTPYICNLFGYFAVFLLKQVLLQLKTRWKKWVWHRKAKAMWTKKASNRSITITKNCGFLPQESKWFYFKSSLETTVGKDKSATIDSHSRFLTVNLRSMMSASSSWFKAVKYRLIFSGW